jgi:ribosomal protein S27AE
LALNPGNGGAANPLCPECGEPIRALEGEHERRFVCGCDGAREFRFEEAGGP